uniref:L-serine ammonia-lyase n=1 Tax=Bionectria ochroleuca TaxID=29856 RepID=A0A8H7TPZ2_BIOOC
MVALPAGAKIPWIKSPCVLSPELSRIAATSTSSLTTSSPAGPSSPAAWETSWSGQQPLAPRHPLLLLLGGNAGLACATSAISLGCTATIVIPTSAPAIMISKLLALGVEVVQVGSNWAESDAHLRGELLARDPTGVYVPPFDHPQIWDGAATIVTELREQLGDTPLHGIICSVGGGGLLNGIMQGVESASSWPEGAKPKVIAVETTGADSLNASVRAGEHVTLPGITSIAKSLGATRVSDRTWRWSQESSNLESMAVSDADAAISCVRFADDARTLVEGLSDEEWAKKNVVIEVCGGANVTLALLAEYRETYAGETTIKR